MANTSAGTQAAAKDTSKDTGSKDTSKTTAPKRERKREEVKSMMAMPWKPEKEGDCLEGTYLGMEMVKGKGKRRDFPSYHIQQDNGERVRIASAMLNTKLNQVPKGTYVWLTYVGEFKTDNGNSSDYKVDVEQGTELIDPLEHGGSQHGVSVD